MIGPQDLTTPATSDQIMQGWIDQLEALGVPASQWRTGGAARTILAVFAITVAGFSTFLASLVNGFFLPTSSGNFLTLLAYYVYGVTKAQATFASGVVTLTNTGGALYTHAAGEVSVKNSTTDAIYVLGSFSIAPGTTVKGVAVTALVQGSASNATPGQIDTLVTTMIGVTIANPASVVGLDAQSDDDLRATCLASIPALSPNGPAGAYDYAIRTATRADGSPVNVNRWQVLPDSSTGLVSIFIASPSGTASAEDIADVQLAIELRFEKDVTTALVQGSSTTTFATPLTLWCVARPGLSAPALAAQVSTAITSFFATYPIGGLRRSGDGQGKLFGSAIDGVVRALSSDVFAIDGAQDIPLVAGQVPVFGASVFVQLVST